MDNLNTDHSGIDLPTAPDAEASILALIIEEPKRFARKAWEAQISSEFFSAQPNAAMFRILMDRIRSQRPVDPSSIKEDIRKLKPEGLAISDLAAILNQEKSDEGWEGYMAALRDTHARRLIITAATSSAGQDGRQALDAMRKASEAASAALEGLSAVSDSKKAVNAFLKAFLERKENGLTPGISTGIEAIDQHTGGMRKGELWVIGAKTSGGKSILMIQMASEAVANGKRVAIFTLELATEEIVGRMISCMGRIPISQIMNPSTVTDYYWPKIEDQVKKLKDTGLLVCDSPDLTIDTISGHCIRLQETKGLDLVVIDYVQMVASPRIKGQNREQEVASISRACKQLAKRLRCPVLTATQLNEAGQSRESRAIEHDADNLFVIDHKADKEKPIVTIQAWKCRNGVRGTIFNATMDGLHQKFTVTN
jgi:replicative DNA helicase